MSQRTRKQTFPLLALLLDFAFFVCINASQRQPSNQKSRQRLICEQGYFARSEKAALWLLSVSLFLSRHSLSIRWFYFSL